MRNTLKNGQIRTIIFKDGGSWHGVALELNIVASGNDPREVMLMLDEAIRGYIETARKTNASDRVVNQRSDPEYEKLYALAQGNKRFKSPLKVYSVGTLSVPTLQLA